MWPLTKLQKSFLLLHSIDYYVQYVLYAWTVISIDSPHHSIERLLFLPGVAINPSHVTTFCPFMLFDCVQCTARSCIIEIRNNIRKDLYLLRLYYSCRTDHILVMQPPPAVPVAAVLEKRWEDNGRVIYEGGWFHCVCVCRSTFRCFRLWVLL